MWACLLQDDNLMMMNNNDDAKWTIQSRARLLLIFPFSFSKNRKMEIGTREFGGYESFALILY